MYDTLRLVCPDPECGCFVSFTSYTGENQGIVYSQENAPLNILAEAARESKAGRVQCLACGMDIAVVVNWIATTRCLSSQQHIDFTWREDGLPEPENPSIQLPEVEDRSLFKSWRQPHRQNIRVDSQTVCLAGRKDFDLLVKIDSTEDPPEVYVGKMWKIYKNGKWKFCWYHTLEDSEGCYIEIRDIDMNSCR